MKYFSTALILCIFTGYGFGQNIGINNADPKVSLDISGAFAHRSVSLNPYLNAVNLPSNISFGIIEPIDVDGPVSIIDPEIWIDGRRLVLWNNTGFIATFAGVSIEPNGVREFICKATAGGWKPIGDGESQLEKITEAANSGWRLLGRNPDFYGSIGTNAVDFSYSFTPSLTLGATGEASSTFGFSTTASDVASIAAGYGSTSSGYVSLSFGLNSTASGYISTAIGNTNMATGSMTTAIGRNTIARSYASLAIGRFNDTIAGSDQLSWIENDPIFTIGNGVDALNRSNAMTVYKNGNTDISGYTKLGKVSESAPSIKMKKIVNTGPALNGNKLIPHGLDTAKILEIEIFMEWQVEGFPASPTRVVPPNFTSLSGLNYQYELLDANIIIYNINGTEIAGRNLRILITYEE